MNSKREMYIERLYIHNNVKTTPVVCVEISYMPLVSHIMDFVAQRQTETCAFSLR